MEVGLGSLSPAHREELARAGMTVVPIPRGLGQASPGQQNFSASFNTNPQNTANMMVALGVTSTGSSPGASPTCSGVWRLAYVTPAIGNKLGLRPVGNVQGGLTTSQMQQLLGAFLSDGNTGAVDLPYPIPAGSNVVLAQGGTFSFNGVTYALGWRRFGKSLTPVIDVCLPHAAAVASYMPATPYTPPAAPVAPASSNTWLWILGAVVIGGVVIYAVD